MTISDQQSHNRSLPVEMVHSHSSSDDDVRRHGRGVKNVLVLFCLLSVVMLAVSRCATLLPLLPSSWLQPRRYDQLAQHGVCEQSAVVWMAPRRRQPFPDFRCIVQLVLVKASPFGLQVSCQESHAAE